MRDDRLPPLPAPDNGRTAEYWRSWTYGSVSVLHRRNAATVFNANDNAVVNAEEGDATLTDESTELPNSSNDSESKGTECPKVSVPPPQEDTVPDLREPRWQSQNDSARTRETEMASKPKEPVALKVVNETDHSSSPSEVVSRMAPLVEEPLRDDEGNVCLLTTSNYVVSGSVGPHPNAMRPHHIALDTGSGYNVIRLSDLPNGWEKHRIRNATLPTLGDANGIRLRLLGKVALRVRFGSAMYQVAFLVAERLAVSVIIGTTFMNRHVRGIMCMDGEVWLTRAKIPILSRHQR